MTGSTGQRAARALTVACLGVPLATSTWADTLAVVGGTVIDGTGGPPRPDTTLLIEGERIRALIPDGVQELPAAARIIDARGRWVIPGLIDAHVHFFQSGGLFTRPDVIDLREQRPYPEEIRRIRADIDTTLGRYVASGITGVVDMGGPMWTFAVRERAAALAAAPRVAVTGPLLGSVAPAELQGLDDSPILRVTTVAEAQRQVQRLLPHAPDLIKVWLVSPRDLTQDIAWVRAVVEAADGHGVPVVAHATERTVAEAAIDAGVDVLAHSVDDAPLGDDLLARMVRQDVVYVTTLVVNEGYMEVLSDQVDLSPIERRLGDPQVIASWSALSHPWAISGAGVSRAEAVNLQRVAAHGVTVAAGSDAGNIGTLHGPGLHRELELMVEAGLSPAQVLVAATHGGARAMGRAAELGTLAPGKLADLVILDADPLADIRNTRRILGVIKGGQVVWRGPAAANRAGAAHSRRAGRRRVSVAIDHPSSLHRCPRSSTARPHGSLPLSTPYRRRRCSRLAWLRRRCAFASTRQG